MAAGRARRTGTDIRLRRRVAAVSALCTLASGVLVFRLVDLQVVHPDRYVDHGTAQRLRVEDLPAARGAIVDRNGTDLAVSVPVPSVVADPALVVDPVGTAGALAPLLGVDAERLTSQLAADSRFQYLARHVPDEVAEAVQALNLPGVLIIEEPARAHPDGGVLAAAVIGSTDGWESGRSGLELIYDDVLTGEPGERVVETGPGGRTIPTGEHHLDPAEPGETLVLTLDRTLQFEAERILADAITRTGAVGGVLLAADPRTGDIVVDANVVVGEDGVARPATEHKAVTWVFEPGSVMKPVTFAGVFEDGVGQPGSVKLVDDTIVIYDEEIEDDREHEPVQWTIESVLAESSNVGTVLWAYDLGEERLHHWLDAFGFGRPTNLGFPGEARGILPPVEDWSGLSLPTISFGQGVAVTPLQILSAYTTIANGGVSVEPRLVLGTRSADGTYQPAPPSPTRRVVSEQTAAWLTTALTKVVAEGTGQRAGVPGLAVAGKTGTAWKPREEAAPEQNGDELDGYCQASGCIRYVASFAGFLPAHAPELVAVIVLDEPKRPDYSGGRAAAPAFAEFAGIAARQLRMSTADAVVATDGTRVRVPPQAAPEPVAQEGEGGDGTGEGTTSGAGEAAAPADGEAGQ